MLCKHNKLRTLVASLVLQQVKEVGTSAMKYCTNNACNCTPQFYIILALSASIFGLILFAIMQARRTKLCKGQLFSNAVKIMLFISDVQYYVAKNYVKPQAAFIYSKLWGY